MYENKKKIRVVIANKSAFSRARNVQYLSEYSHIDIVGKTNNEDELVKLLQEVKSDVIVIGLEMFDLTGTSLIETIRKNYPNIGILLVSSTFKDEAEFTLQALRVGADDFLMKSMSGSEEDDIDSYRIELILKINKLYLKNYPEHSSILTNEFDKTHVVYKQDDIDSQCKISLRPNTNIIPRIIVIGSSTGGPDALICLLKDLTNVNKNIPILIVQHVMLGFSKILAEQLSQACGIKCVEATNDMPVLPNTVYIAPGGRHMAVDHQVNTRIKIFDDERINYHKPSVDPLFKSVAEIYGSTTLAIMLTGIGSDGLAGTKDIVKANGTVIAQDKKTSVVWGMPGSVAKAGYANAVLPIDKIGLKVKYLTYLRKTG